VHGTATAADLDETTSIGDHDMTLTQTGLRVVAATILVGIVLAGCGGRFGARGADGADSGADLNADAVTATARPSLDADTHYPSAEPSASASPPASAAPATSAAPKPTPKPTLKPTPVPTPDLDALDALINQLDAALAADATATTDEGSPE
jgi:hypothetical protein